MTRASLSAESCASLGDVDDDAGSGAGVASGGHVMEEIRFRVPAPWKRALQGIAHRQAIDLGDVLRIMVRGFMRERLTPEQQAEFEVGD